MLSLRGRHLIKKRHRNLTAMVSLAFALQGCQTGLQQKANSLSKEDLQSQILETQLSLVQNSIDQGQPEKAHKLLREALAKHPEDHRVHNFMGLTQLALNNPKRAIEHFQKSFEKEASIGVGLNLSSALIENGQYKEALSKLHLLLKDFKAKNYAYPERIYHNVGFALVKAGKKTQAIKFFKKALEENPTFFPTHLELGRLYTDTNNGTLAVISLLKARDYCLSCYEPIELLVRSYKAAKAPAEAEKLLLAYIKQNDLNERDRVAARALLKETMASNPSKSDSQSTISNRSKNSSSTTSYQ